MEERGNIPKGSIKVIGTKGGSDLKCHHSTDLYPGWVFAAAYPRNKMDVSEVQGIATVSYTHLAYLRPQALLKPFYHRAISRFSHPKNKKHVREVFA